MDFGGGDEILFERRGKAGVVTLNRPKALNAVTHKMVLALSRALAAWENDDAIAAVVLKAEGRAFSAGGDIMDIYQAGRAGNPPVQFFADEYRLNAAIPKFPKPYVALIDGIVMGGGVGVSFHGSHRVLGDKAVFAMPEVGIGFFPDVGGSYLLSRLKSGFGMYLGLTGARIGAGDACWAGLATHAARSEDFGSILEGIAATGDPNQVLKEFAAQSDRAINEADILAIGHHFSRGTLSDLVESLRQAGAEDEFAQQTLATMLKRSPTSLNVAFRQIEAGGALTMDECMVMEFRILNRMLAGHDFYEGIRAAVVDKDNAPEWRPATLEEVDEAEIEAYFLAPPDGDLQLR